MRHVPYIGPVIYNYLRSTFKKEWEVVKVKIIYDDLQQYLFIRVSLEIFWEGVKEDLCIIKIYINHVPAGGWVSETTPGRFLDITQKVLVLGC